MSSPALGRRLALTLAMAVAGVGMALGQQLPPAPARWVLDSSGFLSPSARTTLDGGLEAFEKRQGTQVVVAIFPRLPPGEVLEDWTAKVAESWKVGRARQDDGVVLFLFVDDRALRIEVGRGLEGALTDLEASRIINGLLVPRLRAGDRDGAVLGAAQAMQL